MFERLWIYQRERFPLLVHGPVIAALALSATSFAWLTRQQTGLPGFKPFLVAFISSLGFFFQLRVADEWKDFADDVRFQPYRAVPRGLISLQELTLLGFAVGGIQLALALWLDARLLVALLFVWVFMALMTAEFFLPQWLLLHPLAYLTSHMLIVPLIYLYSAACAGGSPEVFVRTPMLLLLAAGFFSGIVVEMGRKLRAPEEEQSGVRTYSVIWGIGKSVAAWNLALLLAGGMAILAAVIAECLTTALALLLPGLAVAVLCSLFYLKEPTPSNSKLVNVASSCWVLLLYIAMGPPMLLLKMVSQWWRL